MTAAIFILLALVITTVVLVISKLQSNKKRANKFMHDFGQPPDDTDYELGSIKRYASYIGSHETPGFRVDSITWNDLDMDGIFKRINVCKTSVGEEYLYNCLHELNQDDIGLLEREKLISLFTNNVEARLKTQMCLAELGKENYNSLARIVVGTNFHMLRYPLLYTALACMPILAASTLFINVYLGAALIFLTFVVNVIVYHKAKFIVDIETINIRYFSKLLYACKKLTAMEYLDSFAVSATIKENSGVFKRLSKHISQFSSIRKADFLELMIYIDILFLSDMRKYNKFMRGIGQYPRQAHALFKAVGEIDIALSIASFRKSLPAHCLPTFTEGGNMEFSDIFHPLIAQPVFNSGQFQNQNLITGSNASGKSTFIRSLAINGILAQTIYTCAAKEFKARHCLIATSMAVQDNLLGGDSYFVVEIKSLKRILEYAQKYPCACYIDEILRGTNTIERISASAAVLAHLHKQNCLCTIATHDIELTRILADKFDNYHFSESITDDGIEFDYKLKAGPSTTRNAIKLLDFMNFDKDIVKHAEKMASEL